MSIHRLEPAQQFVNRIILLNRYHAPDEDDYADAHHKLGGVHRGFPNAKPHEQAAYLVAHITTAAPFAEANFRTAWDYTADLLEHEGYHLESELASRQELGHAVWDLGQEEGPGAAEAYLVDWFKSRILKTA